MQINFGMCQGQWRIVLKSLEVELMRLWRQNYNFIQI